MIKIEYNLTSFDETFMHFAKCLKVKISNNLFYLPSNTGEGFIKFIALNNGLQVMIHDYTAFGDVLFHRKKSAKDFYILRLDEATEADGNIHSSVFFSKTDQEWFYMTSAQTCLRNVNILISKNWLDRYLADEDAGNILKNYIALKSPLLIYEMMDAEYRRLINELMNLSSSKTFEQIIVQNRIMLILERFFTRLFTRIENVNTSFKIAPDELENIKQVEKELLKELSQPPPSIARLSRMAAMSPSKMKILFKMVFGLPVNQYYQKHRMNKAKAMLLSKKYSPGQTAAALGFSGLGSFNKAFFKVFEQLPVEIAAPLK